VRGGLLSLLRGTIIENLQKRTENFKMYIIILWFSAFLWQVCAGTAHWHLFRAAGKFQEKHLKACNLNASIRHVYRHLCLSVFKKALLWLSCVTYTASVLLRYPVQYYFVYCVCVVQLHFCNISCYNHWDVILWVALFNLHYNGICIMSWHL